MRPMTRLFIEGRAGRGYAALRVYSVVVAGQQMVRVEGVSRVNGAIIAVLAA